MILAKALFFLALFFLVNWMMSEARARAMELRLTQELDAHIATKEKGNRMADLAYRVGRVAGKGILAKKWGRLADLTEEDIAAIEEETRTGLLGMGIELVPGAKRGTYAIVQVEVPRDLPDHDLE